MEFFVNIEAGMQAVQHSPSIIQKVQKQGRWCKVIENKKQK